MIRGKAEEGLVNEAFTALGKDFGAKVYEIDGYDNAIDNAWDGCVEIDFGKYGRINAILEIKGRVTRNYIGAVAFRFREMAEYTPLLVTDYVNPILAEDLRRAGVQFLDTCGNIFIDQAPLYIYTRGNRPKKEYGEVIPRAFKPKGLRVVYALLCNPGLANHTFREIAAATGVALGTINVVFKDLKANGYLIDKGRFGREVIQKERLLKRWLAPFYDTLRPGLLIGKFTTDDPKWWENVQLPHQFFWGGEVAAAKMTQYLKPQNTTIYTNGNVGELLRNYRLRKDPEGEIEILKTFWQEGVLENETIFTHHDMVHPLLIYADLIATNDNRNLETAEIIYNEHGIDRLVRED